jgi:hypothetical protein
MTQPTPCGTCGGKGFVYLTDLYSSQPHDTMACRDCAAQPKCGTCDELRKQIAALSKIDEKGMGHDDAISSIASHVHEIQVLCDAFGYDPSQWLQDEVANDCVAPPKCETCGGTRKYVCLDEECVNDEHEGMSCPDCAAPQAAIEPAAREVVHEQRIVGHASGRQERMPTCVCGKPWPCAGNDISRYAWGNPPFPKYPHETVDSMAEIGEAFMDAMPEGYNWLSSPAEVIADLSNKEYDATRLLAAEREERERITRDRDAKTSRMWELGKQCDQLQQEVAGLRKDAAWGAHNGGAHQLLKIQHATSVELYNALRTLSPDHAVVAKHYELSPEALSGYSGGTECRLAPAKGDGNGR